MMKIFGIAFLIFLTVISCNVPVDTTESIPTNKLDAVEALAEEPKQAVIASKLLLKASFTEPFMYAEFYADKVIFTFPEKDTLIWKQNFDSLNFTKDYSLKGTQNGTSIEVSIENKPCIHPGSGEKWERKAFIQINNTKYQGCAKIN